MEVLAAFEEAGLTCWPINGTLLGIVREGRLIAHDSDVDIGVLWSERQLLLSALKRLSNQGFEIIRVTRSAKGVSIFRDEEYIDIFLYKVEWGFFRRYLTSAGAIDPLRLTFPLVDLEIGENVFRVPKKTNKLLEFWYGSRWQNPERGRARRCDVPSIKLKRSASSFPRFITDWIYRKIWNRNSSRNA